MTTILYGQRELLVRAIGDAQLIIADEVGIDKGSDLEMRWRQRTLKPKPLAIMDPPKPTKKFCPIDGYYLLFSDTKLPIDWTRWAEHYGITPVLRDFPPAAAMAAFLASDKALVRFSPDAAEWYTRVMGTSPMRLDSEVRKLILLGRERVELNELLDLIGDPSHVQAEHILRNLGKSQAIALAQKVPIKQAIPLMVYLGRALENRKSGWALMLSVIRLGADRLKYDYWTGVQMFMHACYEAEKKGNQALVTLELMEAADVVK